MRAFLIFFLFSSCSSSNVLLYRGIAARNSMFTLLCNGKGNVFIWRIDGNEIAIFNGRENVGHSIVNTYNTTSVEFNATLLSASVDDVSLIPVRTSSLDLNMQLYDNRIIQCETDIGRATIGPEVSTTEIPISSNPELLSPTTSPTMRYTASTTEDGCSSTELLQEFMGEGSFNCSTTDLDKLVLDILDSISTYAKKSDTSAEKLKNISSELLNENGIQETVFNSGIFISQVNNCKLLLITCFLGIFHLFA